MDLGKELTEPAIVAAAALGGAVVFWYARQVSGRFRRHSAIAIELARFRDAITSARDEREVAAALERLRTYLSGNQRAARRKDVRTFAERWLNSEETSIRQSRLTSGRKEDWLRKVQKDADLLR